MNPSFVQRLRALFRTRDEAGLELVVTANAFAAVAIGVVAVFKLDGGVGAFCATVGGVFLVLTVCLLSRPTVWVAAILGSLTLTLAPAWALAWAAESLLGQPWPGAILGALLGFGGGICVYWRVTKQLVDPVRTPEPWP